MYVIWIFSQWLTVDFDHVQLYLFLLFFSLSARLFKKYNPEKSESDVDDFELCMWIYLVKYALVTDYCY